MTPKEYLAYWIQEREKIRVAKERGDPKPWSTDWVFQHTYFCNVRREDDRVTRWIRGNWNPGKIGWNDYEYAMVVARFLNWPDTLESLKFRPDSPPMPREIEIVLEARASAGIKIWGNAYVVTTHGLPMGKAQYLCQRVLPPLYDRMGANHWRYQYPTSGVTLAQRYDDYIKFEGMGSFMTAQVLADLKNTPGHPLHEADDWYSWSAPGPGSLRGLEWFYSRKVKLKEYPELINGVREYIYDKHPAIAASLMQGAEQKINMQDLQNCLCEYDKYMRVRHETGRSKRGYPGGSND